MFGVLLESRARRHRRAGGAALSFAAHLAIVSAATAATVAGPVRVEPMKPHLVPVTAPPPNKPEPQPRRVVRGEPRIDPRAISNINIRVIEVPIAVPVDLPPIDLRGSVSADSIVIGSGSGSKTSLCKLACLQLDEESGSNEWRGNEALMHLLAAPKPRYPESLRVAGISGDVLVRFTVDTLGRVDPASVQILKSTHDQFTRSVRDALSTLRFRPAEAGGKRVPALAEMPFEFKVNR